MTQNTESDPSARREATRSRSLALVGLSIVAAAGAVIVFLIWAALRDGAETACVERQSAPAGTLYVGESIDMNPFLTLLPAGLWCDYPMVTGGTTTVFAPLASPFELVAIACASVLLWFLGRAVPTPRATIVGATVMIGAVLLVAVSIALLIAGAASENGGVLRAAVGSFGSVVSILAFAFAVGILSNRVVERRRLDPT